MHRVIFFLFIVFFIGCRPSEVPRESRPVVTPPQISGVDISATLLALPSSPSIESSHIVLQAFFDSYNRHDVAGVLDTFAEGDQFRVDEMIIAPAEGSPAVQVSRTNETLKN